MGSRMRARLAVLAWLALFLPAPLFPADGSGRWLDVEFPRDSPVLPVSFSLLGPTTAGVRGTSMVLDLHASLLLRNTGSKPISGLTLMVEAQDLTPSGRGSVTVPSLHALPGEVFPVRVDMELLRPFNIGKSGGAMVQVSLDCALFSDLTAYGPDTLHSRRTLVVYEMEARRDRRYLASLLGAGQLAELREELNFGIQDMSPAQLGLELLRGPGSGVRREQALAVDAVAFASSPIKPLGGDAKVSGNEVTASRLQLRNISDRQVQGFEVGWIVRDGQGRDFVAGSVPSALHVAPVETVNMTQPGRLRFSHPGGSPMVVDGLLAFVNDVEFADGKLWIPSRGDIRDATRDPILRRALSSSPEQQRLADIYRRKGMSGLEQELKRVN